MTRFTLFFAILSASGIALAFPTSNLAELRETNPVASQASDSYDYWGIVALDDCSGSLVRFEKSLPSDAAMVLTNGHCNENGMPEAGVIQQNIASSRSFDLLGHNAESIGSVTAEMIMISTMTKTDVTLYRLTESFSGIQSKYGVTPLTISSRHPVVGAPLEILSGYWRKGYSCDVDKFIYRLKEDAWTMNDSIRFTEPGCETIAGTSGSPLIDPVQRQIIGINNTGNESGEKCTLDNPCEVDSSGKIFAQKGLSYGQQTYWLNTCLDKQRQVDLRVPGCQY